MIISNLLGPLQFIQKILELFTLHYGLSGETGEVAEKVKKTIRDNGGIFTDEKKVEIAKELGDILWYISAVASDLDISLQWIAESNKEKLESRLQRNVIQGNGDNR